jgi:hypothetical protein
MCTQATKISCNERQFPPEIPQLTPDEWMSVLKLSTVWEFESVRAMAIDRLDEYATSDPVLRIVVAKRFIIPRWFVPALNILAQREDALNEKDMERLMDLGSPNGVCKFLLKVAQLRETLLKQPTWTRTAAINQNYCYWEDVQNPNGYRLCETHDRLFDRCPDAHHDTVNPIPRRSEHDFTNEITRIFECVIDEGRQLIPQDSSWDFT